MRTSTTRARRPTEGCRADTRRDRKSRRGHAAETDGCVEEVANGCDADGADGVVGSDTDGEGDDDGDAADDDEMADKTCWSPSAWFVSPSMREWTKRVEVALSSSA